MFPVETEVGAEANVIDLAQALHIDICSIKEIEHHDSN